MYMYRHLTTVRAPLGSAAFIDRVQHDQQKAQPVEGQGHVGTLLRVPVRGHTQVLLLSLPLNVHINIAHLVRTVTRAV